MATVYKIEVVSMHTNYNEETLTTIINESLGNGRDVNIRVTEVVRQ